MSALSRAAEGGPHFNLSLKLNWYCILISRLSAASTGNGDGHLEVSTSLPDEREICYFMVLSLKVSQDSMRH